MVHPKAFIGGDPETRELLRDPSRSAEIMMRTRPVIAQSAHVGPFATVDAGTTRPTYVGPYALILAHAHIGHDATIGDGAEICTGAVIGGFAEVWDSAKVGLNATVLPYRKVGRGATIGAGAVVTKDVPAGETWAGNPARKLEDVERDPRPHTERAPITQGAAIEIGAAWLREAFSGRPKPTHGGYPAKRVPCPGCARQGIVCDAAREGRPC